VYLTARLEHSEDRTCFSPCIITVIYNEDLGRSKCLTFISYNKDRIENNNKKIWRSHISIILFSQNSESKLKMVFGITMVETYLLLLFTAIGFAPGGSSPTLVQTKMMKQHYTIITTQYIKTYKSTCGLHNGRGLRSRNRTDMCQEIGYNAAPPQPPFPKPSSSYFSLIYIRLKYTQPSRLPSHMCGDRNNTEGFIAIIQGVRLFAFRGGSIFLPSGKRRYLGSK
jgi:hypothetical protein